MEIYDVIIVGAGPAGLACAEKLGGTGLKVLLLEKNKVVGPKVCAGGLTAKDLSEFDIPEEILDRKFSEAIVNTLYQTCIINKDICSVYTIDRKKFGQWQLSKIDARNITVRTDAMVTRINDDHIVIKDSEKVGFKYLVGADGSNSTVRAHLDLKVKDIVIAMHYLISTDKYQRFEFFFNAKLFGSGYAWIFPHENYASIGCGCDAGIMPSKKLKEGFEVWLKKNKIDVSQGVFEASPINYDYRGYKFGNVFLAGDAAGLASGLTGEGIYQALVSGEEVANSIINKKYESGRIMEIARKKLAVNRFSSFLKNSLPILGFEIELLFFLMKSKWFRKKMVDFIT